MMEITSYPFCLKDIKKYKNTKKFLHLIHELIIIFDKSEITYDEILSRSRDEKD